jgi:hypothetical protein
MCISHLYSFIKVYLNISIKGSMLGSAYLQWCWYTLSVTSILEAWSCLFFRVQSQLGFKSQTQIDETGPTLGHNDWQGKKGASPWHLPKLSLWSKSMGNSNSRLKRQWLVRMWEKFLLLQGGYLRLRGPF